MQSSEVMNEVRGMMHQLQDYTFFQEFMQFDNSRNHLVEAWRSGILVYSKRLFPSADDAASDSPAVLAKKVLSHAERIPPATSMSYSLLWPIFQSGIVLGEEASAEKEQIKGRLRIALAAVGCRHFSNALETLEVVWDNYDRQDPTGTGTFGLTVVLG